MPGKRDPFTVLRSAQTNRNRKAKIKGRVTLPKLNFMQPGEG